VESFVNENILLHSVLNVASFYLLRQCGVMSKKEKLKIFMSKQVKVLQKYVNRLWYAPFLGLVAALDNIFLIIPNDGILISSSILAPKRWFWLALWVSIGSALGALALAALVEINGLPWIIELFPGINESSYWKHTHDFFDKYGLLVVFIVAVTPLVQQPVVILASLAEAPLDNLVLVIFIGRFIKFLIMAYAASHAPKLLSKMWGVQGELEDLGIKVK